MAEDAPPAPPGRGELLGSLDDLLDSAALGSGGFIVVRGQPGAGKTGLLEEALERAANRGFTVLRGSGTSDGAARPFGPLLDALAASGATIDDATRPQPRTGSDLADLALRITDDVIHEVEARCEVAPVALAIDDLHGCDGGTLRTLRSLGLRSPALRLAIVATELDDGSPGLLDHVADPVLYLAPPRGEVRAEAARRVTAAIDSLDATARRVLRGAAVLGADADVATIAALTGDDDAAIRDALAAAVAFGDLDERDDVFVWRDNPVRDVVARTVPESILRSIHDEAAEVLVRAGAPATRVAEHLVHGHGASSDDPVRWLRQAARECWTSAPLRAISFLRRGAELAGPLADERDELLLEMVGPLTWTNQHAEAEVVAREVLARARTPERRRDAHIELAMSLQHNGRVAEAAALWDVAGDDAIESDPDRAGLLLATFGYNALLEGSLDDVAARAATATRHGEQLAHDGLRSTGEMLAGLVDLASWRAGAAAEHAARAVELSADGWLGGPAASLVLALARIELDELPRAHDAIVVGRELIDRLGSGTYAPALQWASLGESFLAGRWDDALAGVDAGLALVDELGLPTGRALALAVRAVIHHHRGDPGSAEDAVAAAERSVIEHGPQLGLDWAMWARALLVEEGAQPDVAAVILGSAWDATAAVRGMITSRVFAPDLVRLALLLGDRARAIAVTEVLELGARHNPTVSLRSAGLRCRALVDDDVATMSEAAAVVLTSPRPLERAATLADAATMHARAGGPAEASRLADGALAEYAALGATRSIDALIARLRTEGVHRGGARSAEPRAMTGWDALTDAEAKVASLVASGLTNRQVAARLYISRHTVDSHLRRVFAKLAVGSRVELAAIVDGHR